MSKRSLVLAGGVLKVGFQAGVLQLWLDEAASCPRIQTCDSRKFRSE
jgi:hypothetical protein